MNKLVLKKATLILPLFALACMPILNSCGEKAYYHDDTTLNNLKGNISKIHDSSYFATPDPDNAADSIINFGNIEYVLDEDNHLLQENYTQYILRKVANGSRMDTLSYVHRFNHYSYNPKGRKSETREISRTVGEDFVLDDTITTRLQLRDGNSETWLQERSSNFMEGKMQQYFVIRYTEDTREMTYKTLENQPENLAYTIHHFNKEGQLTEYIVANEYGDIVLNDTYEYNADGYVVKKVSRSTDFTNEASVTRYQPSTPDEQGNWSILKEYDNEGNLRQLTHRRIEYR